MTVMRNTCQQWNMEYAVKMSKEDWEGVYSFYETYDADGNAIKKSVMKDPDCADDPNNPDWKECTFILGLLPSAICARE